MLWMYVDCETMPRADILLDESKVKVPGTYRKPESIAEYKRENAYHSWRGLAKHRAKAQVFMVGLALDDDNPPKILQSSDERSLFGDFDAWWRAIPKDDSPNAPENVWCAYNGVGFDFWMLGLRALRHGFKELAADLIPRSKWGDARHKDPYVALGQEGSLETWAEFFCGLKHTPPLETMAIQARRREAKLQLDDPTLPFEYMRWGHNDYAQLKCGEDVFMLRALSGVLRDGGIL